MDFTSYYDKEVKEFFNDIEAEEEAEFEIAELFDDIGSAAVEDLEDAIPSNDEAAPSEDAAEDASDDED